MLPDEQDCVEHWLKELNEGNKVIHAVQLLQVLAQGLQILDSVIGLQAGGANIFQQPVQRHNNSHTLHQALAKVVLGIGARRGLKKRSSSKHVDFKLTRTTTAPG